MVLNSWLVLHRMIRSAALMNCQWTRNHPVFYPHICASRNCVQTSEAPQNMAGLQFDGQLVKQLSRLASTTHQWVSECRKWAEILRNSWHLTIMNHQRKICEKKQKGHLKFESIWISLVTFLFFRMRVDDHVTFTTRGRYIYCTLPLLSWWWWSLPQDMIILMIIWWRPFLHHDYHWKDLSQKYFYCFDSNQHNDEPPGIPLMDSEDKEL